MSTFPSGHQPVSDGHCFHCGGPLPLNNTLTVKIRGKARPVCSERCRTTAEWIEHSGLGDFYRLRTNAAGVSGTGDGADWNSPALRSHVIRDKGDGLHEVCLLVDGMHCAGCVWLIERALLQLGGVSDIQINPVTHRARLTFDENKITLAAVLTTLEQAGYQPRPLESFALDDARGREHRDLLKRLLVAGFGMMQVMTYAFVLYLGDFAPLPDGTAELFRWLGFLVATPIVFYSAQPFFKSARSALRYRALNMDVPIAIAITAVYVSSVYQAVMQQGDVYFDSVSMLVFFLLTGRYLEMRARHHSVDNADALIRLTPTFAERRSTDGTLEQVPVTELKAGDRVQVAEGAHVPADGVLINAHTLLDESLMSGEASARQRLAGDTIVAGSLVLEGPIEIHVTRVGSDTFLSVLADLSTRAQTQRPKLTRQSERATARFVGRVLVFTTITLAGWLWYDPSRALEATIALLVVACPCALGLAAPAAITRALGVLARKSILVIQPDALDTLTRIDTAIFDKTGTLTEPELDVSSADPTVLQLAASLARESQHPLSRALVAQNKQPLLVASQTSSVPGMGLEGVVANRHLKLGQPRFALDAENQVLAQEAALVLGENGKLLASFRLTESLRADALSTLTQLGKARIHCEILSGDSQERVDAVAAQLPVQQAKGRLLPADKLAHLKALHANKNCVLAVGDGSNDAPVLAGADVSIALTSGAELAQANADILLCDGRLAGLLDVRSIAFSTRKILRQNERWAITYNTIAMPLAALGFIPPWLAAICMSASSLTVVLNALRIGHNKAATTPLGTEASTS